MLNINSFRAQLLLLLIGLFSLVLAAVFIAVNQANEDNARIHLEETLQITAVSFQRTLESRKRILLDKARLLSGDFAFKKAIATQDHQTILSVLENHRLRVKANVMMLATLDGKLIASTLHPRKRNTAWSLQQLQHVAENSDEGEVSDIQLLNDKPYQLVLTPLFTPEASAWIMIGFEINDRFSKDHAKQTYSELSLLYKQPQTQWQLLASTLSNMQQNDLLEQFQNTAQTQQNKNTSINTQVNDVKIQGNPYLSLILPIQGTSNGQTIAILQRSLAKALEPYLRLHKVMLSLFGFGLLFSVIGAISIARSLSKPLETLTKNVQHITRGNYRPIKVLQRKDELGTLSRAVNKMRQGLQERDQVRNLLGKVVSPEIAQELLSKDIELGGEERQATILFSDIRSFTQLCENRDPKTILNLLNRYLSCMSNVIEQHQGVIDKYIGDAIMALFDVPIRLDNAPEQAVLSALNMIQALEKLNTKLIAEEQRPIHIGIGINSGSIVAGNMGSLNRLNYTVIGDGVNLASRLEGLTKYFGVNIIVSESVVQRCNSVNFRELGRVQVKGKKNAIGIFEPLPLTALNRKEQKYLAQYQQALEYFRHQQWQEARSLFQRLHKSCIKLDKAGDTHLYDLYLKNINLNEQKTLPENWQGVLVFETK